MKISHSSIMVFFLIIATAFLMMPPHAYASTVQVIVSSGASTPKCSPACFLPSDISVSKDTTISWLNKDFVAHTITSGNPSDSVTGSLFDSGLIPPGGHFEHKFDSIGIYHYFDQVHPWATGIIRVSQNPGSVNETITAITDRDSYYGGDSITITGATNNFVSSSVLITIKDPQKNTVISRNVPLMQDSNLYKFTTNADKNFTLSGTYEVEAKYGTATSQTFFDFKLLAPKQDVLQATGDGNSLQPRVISGESTQLGLVFKLDQGYDVELLELSLEGLPDGVLSWINPNRLDSVMNSNHTIDAQIPIFVNSGVKPGIYVVNLVGNGNILNKTSGNQISFDRQRIASITLTVVPSGNTISIGIGQMDYTGTQFCTDTEPSGNMCTGFVSREEFPITVTSDKHQTIRLDALKVPKDGYIKFIPDILDVESNGSSKMIMAGIMDPFGINPYDTTAMAVRASSTDGDTAISYIPIIDRGGITILSKPGAIELEGDVITSGSQAQIISYGVVYDPSEGPKTLPVKLEALGLVNGSDIVPFTPSFSVKIPRDTFVLNATQPFYFMVETVAKSLPSGKITFALGQDVGDKYFVQNVTMDVSNVRHGGSINLGGIDAPVPENEDSSVKLELNQSSDSWTIPAIIGIFAGGVGGIFSFLLLKRKPVDKK